MNAVQLGTLHCTGIQALLYEKPVKKRLYLRQVMRPIKLQNWRFGYSCKNWVGWIRMIIICKGIGGIFGGGYAPNRARGVDVRILVRFWRVKWSWKVRFREDLHRFGALADIIAPFWCRIGTFEYKDGLATYWIYIQKYHT